MVDLVIRRQTIRKAQAARICKALYQREGRGTERGHGYLQQDLLMSTNLQICEVKFHRARENILKSSRIPKYHPGGEMVFPKLKNVLRKAVILES